MNSIDIPIAFDPSALEKHIAELEDAIPTMPEIPAPYDDEFLRDSIKELSETNHLIETKGSIPTKPVKEYDDTELQKSIDAIREVQQEIQKELARPITISLGEAKAYEGLKQLKKAL